MCSISAHVVCNFASWTIINKIHTAMRIIDNISTCTLDGNKFASVLHHVNTVFNVFGIMFFVVFLSYIAIHCFWYMQRLIRNWKQRASTIVRCLLLVICGLMLRIILSCCACLCLFCFSCCPYCFCCRCWCFLLAEAPSWCSWWVLRSSKWLL